MEHVEVINGEIFTDDRGQISSLNSFHFEGVKRCYFLHHPDTDVIRGWNGHEFERKWFCCIRGKFTLGLVRINDWKNPSPSLVPEIFLLSDSVSRIICVPAGYANWIKAGVPDSILLVLSDKLLSEATEGNWRYDKSMWMKPTGY